MWMLPPILSGTTCLLIPVMLSTLVSFDGRGIAGDDPSTDERDSGESVAKGQAEIRDAHGQAETEAVGPSEPLAERAAIDPSAPARDDQFLELSRQILLVVTDSWESLQGIAYRYQRFDVESPWASPGQPLAVVVGRSGLGWARGSQAPRGDDDPIKQEGDGRAPAGVFSLTRAFGYGKEGAVDREVIKLDYLPSTRDLVCVDDPVSTHYNQIVDRHEITQPDWSTSEDMLRQDGLYQWGVIVEHNTEETVPGDGSCIFLHVWRSPSSPTLGCTAFSPDDVVELLSWLDPSLNPRLVQLPLAVYASLKDVWRLPNISIEPTEERQD